MIVLDAFISGSIFLNKIEITGGYYDSWDLRKFHEPHLRAFFRGLDKV
jgi:hypothetical protein